MRRLTVTCLGVLLLGACRGPQEYSAPAPAGALECALRAAEEIGYQRMTGEPGERYVRMSQRVELPAEIDPRERDPLPGPDAIRPILREQPLHNELALREDGGRLRIEIVSTREGEEVVRAGENATAHAQRILAACSA